MSQEGSVIGNRLGISKDWIADFGFYQEKENLKNTLLIREWFSRMFHRLGLWLLAIQLVKRKNIVEVHVLMTYFSAKAPLIHNAFFYLTGQEHWYWLPVVSGYFKPYYGPKNILRFGASAPYILKSFLAKKYSKLWMYRKIYMILIEMLLEDKVTKMYNALGKVYLYNLVDYYDPFGRNHMVGYIKETIKLFPKEQYKINQENFKTSLFFLCLGIARGNSLLIARAFAYEARRTSKWTVSISFLLKIVNEAFYVMPDKFVEDDVALSGATSLRIRISGKKEDDMRAFRQNYYFSNITKKGIPRQKLSKNIDYSLAEARTKAGILGIKVWIY